MPWALAGVTSGAVVSTAATAATARVIFIMWESSLGLIWEAQRAQRRRVSTGAANLACKQRGPTGQFRGAAPPRFQPDPLPALVVGHFDYGRLPGWNDVDP